MTLPGVELSLECPSCGNIITKECPLLITGKGINIPYNLSCACGRRANFTILSMNQQNFISDKYLEKAVSEQIQDSIKKILGD